MINNFTVIDAHCHVYPHKILPRAVDATAVFYGEKAFHDGTVEQLIDFGTKSGIDRFIIQSVATSEKQVRSINEFIAYEVALHPDRLWGLGTVHPESGDMLSDIKHIKELGLHGIKIHPDIQGFAADCAGFEKAYDICEQLSLPVLMHTGDKRYDYSNPNRIAPLLKRHPKLTVIGAHLGGWSIWEDAVDHLCDFENFFVDTSSAICYISPENGREIIRRYGKDRVIFGTDYPLHNIAREVEDFLKLDLTPDESKAILCENAKRIYNF